MDLLNIILVMIISTVLLKSGFGWDTWQYWVIIVCTATYGIHNKLKGFDDGKKGR